MQFAIYETECQYTLIMAETNPNKTAPALFPSERKQSRGLFQQTNTIYLIAVLRQSFQWFPSEDLQRNRFHRLLPEGYTTESVS